MANAGTIVVGLVARTEAFVKGMKRSQRTIGALEKATAATMRRIKMFGAIAIAAAGYGLYRVTKEAMQNIDTIAKLSDRIGVSTEFLAAFGHQAKIAGLEQAAFNKGIEMFVRRLGEVKQGTGEAKYGLDALNLNVDDLIKMGAEESFLRIAEGIRGLGNQSEKAAAAYRFFGRSGAQMLNLLEGNLSGVIDRAEELGITFNRMDAAKIEAANDAITDMKAALAGVGNTLAVSVSPYVEFIADKITTIVSGNNSIEAMQERIQKVAIAASYVGDVFIGIRGVVNGIVGLGQKLMQYFYRMSVILTDIAAKIASFLKLEDVSKNLTKLADGLDEIQAEFGKAATKNLNQSLDNFMDIGSGRKKLQKMFDEINKKSAEAAKKPVKDFTPEPVKDFTPELEAGKSTDYKSGSVEIFRSQNISLAGLREKNKTDPNTQILTEMLSIQRKAFA